MSTTASSSPKSHVVPVVIALVAAVVLLALVLRKKRTDTHEAAPAIASAVAEKPLVDLRGKSVAAQPVAKKLAIDDARYLVALSLIHPEPASVVAAWAHDVNRLGPETYAQLKNRSPGLEKLPKVGSSAGSFDVEAVLAASPDVAVLSLESNVSEAQRAQLEGAGIRVVVVDFFVKPLENLERSVELLGALVGREEAAHDFVAFRAEHMKRIEDRLGAIAEADRPKVFLEAHAGMNADCCNSPGRGTIGDYLSFVGGHNIGADVLPQPFGKLNLEYVIAQDPAVYIATGGPHLEKAGGLVLGAGYDAKRAAESLDKVAHRRGLGSLTAVKNRRVFGLSHQLLNSPLDIVAIEAAARWIHPKELADIDPAVTLAEVNRRFLPTMPHEGVYWTELP